MIDWKLGLFSKTSPINFNNLQFFLALIKVYRYIYLWKSIFNFVYFVFHQYYKSIVDVYFCNILCILIQNKIIFFNSLCLALIISFTVFSGDALIDYDE